MQITQTKNEGLSREYAVTMTAEEIAAKMNEQLAELSRTVRIPGFRPGKAPLSLLKTKYGKSVMGEVLESAVNESTLKAINENQLRPAMRPRIEVTSFDEATGLEYKMEVEILPEIALQEMDRLELEKLMANPDEKSVQEAIQRILRSSKKTQKVEEKRVAATGDVVLIDFDGTVDGKPFPGMKGTDFELELGSKSFVDTFEDQLLGAYPGDAREVNVTFPADYGHEKLRNVQAVFAVTVKEIRQSIIPTLNDDFAKQSGFETATKLEEAVRKQIQSEYDRLSRLNVKRKLLDALDGMYDFPLPGRMVEAEFDGILNQMKGAHDHHDPHHVHGPDCEHEHGTPKEREELKKIAARRVKLGLLLAEIGKTNKVDVTTQELQMAVVAEARRYPGQEHQVFEYYKSNPQALEAVKAPIYEDKVVDLILAKAKIVTKEVTIDELSKVTEEDDLEAA